MLSSRFYRFALTAGLCAGLPAQTLLRDFNTTPSPLPASSGARGFTAGPNNGLLFRAFDNPTGTELWFTDGTVPGTVKLTNSFAAANSPNYPQATELSGGVYLLCSNSVANGRELWRTDGTPAGTTLVRDIRPGPESSAPRNLTRVGNQIVFFADDGTNGLELWRTDGTAAGTQRVSDIAPGNASVALTEEPIASLGNGRCAFAANTAGAWQVWVSDTTPAGTQSIYQLPSAFFSPNYFTSLGNRVVFQAGNGLLAARVWATDGTTIGTSQLPAGSAGEFVVAGSNAYFRGLDPITGRELWKTDGTAAGTSIVRELLPGSSLLNDGTPTFVGAFQGEIYFFATSTGGRFLFRSDGTAAGTVPALSQFIGSSAFSERSPSTIANGFLYFLTGFGSSQRDLWRTDGTAAGTTQVTTLGVGSIGSVGPNIFFGADDGTQVGEELWTSDGTPQGTQLFLDILPPAVSISSVPSIVGTFRDRVLVLANDGSVGNELWLTDGTPQGTQLMVDLVPGSGSPFFRGFAANEERIMFFAANTGNDGDPWFSDGTVAGTRQLDILPSNSGFRGREVTPFGSRFVFNGALPGTGEEPWISDGTAAGTFALADIVPGPWDSFPRSWYRFDDAMLFAIGTQSEFSIWRTDGTQAGTSQIASPSDAFGQNQGFQPTRFGDYAYFAGNTRTQGPELWRTDGTAQGTALFLDLETSPFTGSNPSNLVALDAGLVLQATIGFQQRLVYTDGTASGTFTLTQPGLPFDGPYPVNNRYALLIVEGPNGDELWQTDGRDAGTRRVFNTRFAIPAAKIGEDRTLLLVNDGQRGTELWTTDATATGTQIVVDMGPFQSNVRNPTRAGEHIVFVADDGIHGLELFSVPFPDSLDWVAETYGSGCPGTNSVTPAIDVSGSARVSSTQPFELTVQDALPNTFALLAWSTERGPTALPGCTLGVAGQIQLLATPTDANGQADLPLALMPSLLGQKFQAQYLCLDPAGSALGFLSTTAAIEIVFGL
ncbi:MAG: PQQ-binding-like beta-propeller repeat protein [Planctomycetota bacterium]